MGAGLRLTRALHRCSDMVNILTFSLCPFSKWQTELRVGSSRLQLEQWPGAKVGSGGFVWGAARRLSEYLEQHGDGCEEHSSSSLGYKGQAVGGRPWGGLNVLELGSGTGAGGLAALALGAANVTLTDQAKFIYPSGDRKAGDLPRSLLDLMRNNASANTMGTGVSVREASVREMLWGDDSEMINELPHSTFDLVCAADVLLFEAAHEALLQTLSAVSGKATVVLIEHTDRAGGDGQELPPDLVRFVAKAATEGIWHTAIVRNHGRHLTLRMVRQNRDCCVEETS